jgi:hypothetical protein
MLFIQRRSNAVVRDDLLLAEVIIDAACGGGHAFSLGEPEPLDVVHIDIAIERCPCFATRRLRS